MRTFRGLDPATVEMTTLPVDGRHQRQSARPAVSEAQPVLDRLKNLEPPTFVLPEAAKPSTVKVVVVDGSGVKGRAAQVEAALVARGFRSGGSADASSSDYAKTQVRYATGQGEKGLSVAEYIGTGNVVEVASTSVQDGGRILHGDVLVVLGRDYPTCTACRKARPHARRRRPPVIRVEHVDHDDDHDGDHARYALCPHLSGLDHPARRLPVGPGPAPGCARIAVASVG